jgi:hypothetical protein
VREMNVGDFGVMLSGAAMVVLVAVVLVELRCWRIRRATGRVGHRLEEITALVEESQRHHGTRMRGLQRRLELAERAVGRAEDMAYRSVSGMRTLRDDVGPRLLAAERSVGLHDVVVDLDAQGNRAADQGDRSDERPGGHSGSDDDRPERERQPAGQAGSS